MATKLASQEISDLDPDKFMAVTSKRVIHCGGRASTKARLSRPPITASARVLDAGAPGGHDRDRDCPPTRHRGHRGGHPPADAGTRRGQRPGGGVADLVTVTADDIMALPFDDAAFEVVTGRLQTSCKSYRQG